MKKNLSNYVAPQVQVSVVDVQALMETASLPGGGTGGGNIPESKERKESDEEESSWSESLW